MKIVKTYTCNIPAWSVCYLEYGEMDNLSEEDISMIDEWLETLENNGFTNPVFSFGDDNGFHMFPEFGLGCDCVECTVNQFAKD